MAAVTTPMTVEEFLRLPEVEGERLELIHGEVISMSMSGQPHEIVKKNLNKTLVLWLAQSSQGDVFVEAGYRLDEHDALIPDLSVLFPGRLTPGGRGVIRGAPELAVEVVSSETADRLEEKIELYLEHGSKSVWVVYPKTRTVRIFDIQGGARRFERDEPLVDPLLPGFSVPTAAIFEGV
jgi:Uma2 family endonuclease